MVTYVRRSKKKRRKGRKKQLESVQRVEKTIARANRRVGEAVDAALGRWQRSRKKDRYDNPFDALAEDGARALGTLVRRSTRLPADILIRGTGLRFKALFPFD